jgi:hypothetical protein
MVDPGVVRVNIDNDPTLLRVTAETGPSAVKVNAGVQGPQGPAGADGADGVDGVNGSDGANGEGGNIYVDLNSQYGAVGDGVTNNSAAFAQFTSDYRFNEEGSVVAYLPPGEYHWDSSDAIWDHADFGTIGLFNVGGYFQLIGYGASIIDDANTNMSLCGPFFGAFDNSAGNPRYAIDDAQAGDELVTLSTAADAANIERGMWVLLTACHQQINDQPPHNPYIFEYHQVGSADAGTGEISFMTGPVKNGPYLTSYPDFQSQFNESLLPHLWIPGAANSSTPSIGNALWAQETVLIGLTFPQETPTGMAIATPCRKVKFVDCHFGLPPDEATGDSFNSGPLPTGNQEFVLENCYLPWATIEVDKHIERIRLKDSFVDKILFQNGGGGLHTTLDNCTTRLLWGTPKNLYAENCTIGELDFGPRFTGPTQSVSLVNSQINAVADLSSWKNSNEGAKQANFTIADGKITFPVNMSTMDDPPGWAVPGGRAFFQFIGSGIYWQPFEVIGIRQVGSDVVVDTTLPATLSTSISGESNFRIVDHPCPSLSLTNCTGDFRIKSVSPTQDTSFWGSIKFRDKDFSTAPTFPLSPSPSIRGYITSASLNVIKPYTGAQGTVQYQLLLTNYEDVDWAENTAGSLVAEVHTAGKRLLVPGATTGLGGSDTLNGDLPSIGGWMTGSLDFGILDDISAENPAVWPIIEIEVVVNQLFQEFTA